jgi:TolB protein
VRLSAGRRAAAVALATVCACLPSALSAQRAPVLQQIKVRHPYYYREMYIPQPTSGPSSVAWSPDGKELVYSMQGSLWRQRLGSTEAHQLTDGPGYDYQPDWSPDGRWIIYASYQHDAIELRLLNPATGATTPLIADGAVNLEPRWSPDGARIAFVSSAYQGRWHVFTAAITAEGRAEGIERLTEDRESGLPRYYYNTVDQYLSPSWSPDGRELLLISNRGHIWGSGGFWRMPAHAGGSMREVRYEETNWKARPDWSPDGRRVVYSSYLGRQWHQLWLMTADGGDPFQLTYGDFDATSPRWSPDGRRIAYISNEGGNTSLWVVEIPGGRRSGRPSGASRSR